MFCPEQASVDARILASRLRPADGLPPVRHSERVWSIETARYSRLAPRKADFPRSPLASELPERFALVSCATTWSEHSAVVASQMQQPRHR